MDIGTFDQPVLVFRGPYSNLEAPQALLQRAMVLGFPSERMICMGDVVAYCADPNATLGLMASSGSATVMYKCEEFISADSDDCGCRYAEGSMCNTPSVQWYAHARENLTATAKYWMVELSKLIEFMMAGPHPAIIHGAPSAINRFVFESAEDVIVVSEIERSGSDGVLCGH